MSERPGVRHEQTEGVDAARPQRPVRPPVARATAAVVAATRPGRIQAASERTWTAAVLVGAVGLLTAWLTQDQAVAHLLAQVPPGAPDADRREAAGLLHTLTMALSGLGLVLEAVLVAFLRARRVGVRVLLSLCAVLSASTAPLVLSILTVPGWRGIVIGAALGTHAVLALVGSVLTWLRAGRPARAA